MEHVSRLCQAVDEMMGHAMQSPRDFSVLRDRIYSRLQVPVSVSTLKRLWGYSDYRSNPRQSTLDTLAYFLGYDNFSAFCQSQDDGDALASNPVVSRHINVSDDLKKDDELTLSWQPGRLCRVCYLGDQSFQVIASVKTRLQPGDRFLCSVIIEGEPLFLTNLMQYGRPVTNYVCGRNGGVRFER